ncbi:MAG: aldehyde dehydrogenase [Myxococcales bacterium]|nr:aldehyde dehydrogenase [Myxococcales bacterium]
MQALSNWKRPDPIAPTASDEVDAAVAELRARADAWVGTGLDERVALLEQILRNLDDEAEAWIATARRLKGIDPGSNAEGQEWLSGYLAMPRSVRYFIHTLRHRGKPAPISTRKRSTPAGEQTIVRVFPQTLLDKALFTGWTIDLWLEPGARPEQGGIYARKAAGSSKNESAGKVALVMGAGNQIFLGPTDLLHKLFVDDEVVILKMNPVNEVDGPHIERVFAPLIRAGFLRVVYGGIEVGAQLCAHPEVDSIHVTGSDRTYDAIVWGGDPDQRAERKRSGERVNAKPFTAELGCVSPYIIVPGPWSSADLDYHAAQLASALTQNAGHNCAAAQVVLIADGWDQRREFLQRLERAIRASAPRISYYPGSKDHWRRFVAKYPQHEVLGREPAEAVVPWTLVQDVPMRSGEWALTCEGFCGILNIVDIPTGDAEDFLAKAVAFANDELWGNLSASLIVHPKTRRQHAAAVDRAIAELRYGTVAINAWAGAGCALMVSGWGGFPGNTQADIQSGIGMAHNNLLWEPLQKSVMDLPFRIRPKPPWFVDHRNLPAMGRALVHFECAPGLGRLLPVVLAAIKG